MTRRKLFISYSHKDTRWLVLIREQLAVLEAEGLVDAVDDSSIRAGEDWYTRLDHEMRESNVALLLISAPFLSSSFVRKEEIPRLLSRHKQGGMSLYPLLIRHCLWQEVSWLRPLQIRPLNARPVSSFRGAGRDKCLADVAREIAWILKSGGEIPGTVEIREPLALSSEQPRGGEISAVINWHSPVPTSAPGDGVWKPRLYLESLGPGPELTLPGEHIPERSAQSLRPDGSYQYEFKVPAGFVPPGSYKTLVILEYVGSSGAIPPLEHYVQGPIVSLME